MFTQRFIFTQLFLLCICYFSATAQMTFVHPGTLSSKAELDFVKAKIAAQQQPWLGAYNQLVATGYMGAYTKTTSPQDGAENAQRDDARKAYACALAWYYTGNVTYANTAIQVLNVWGRTFNGYAVPPVGAGNQSQLNCGWIGSLMGPAADIMLGYSVANGGNWTAADIAMVRNMFKTKFYPALNQMSYWNGNNDLVQIEAMISLAIFCEDEAEFNLVSPRLAARNPSYFYLSTDNNASRTYGGSTYPGGWNGAVMFQDGIEQESCRDNNHHAQFALTSAIHICEAAWHQGVDLYALNEKRYVTTVELMAQQLVTGSMQGFCGPNQDVTLNGGIQLYGGSPKGLYDILEMAYNHYNTRMNIPLPWTTQLLPIVRRNSAQGNAISDNDWNIFYETLTHADLVETPVAKCSKPNLGIDQGICGKTSVILNSALLTTTNKTLKWSRNSVEITGQTGTNLTATTAGTYRLDVDSAGCLTSDEVIISGTLAVNLGVDKELCNPAVQTLDAGSANGTAATFLWSTGAKTQSIAVTKAGTYSVTVSAANCTSVTDAIVVTSKLLNSIGDTICTAGAVTLTTTEGGAYNWYDVATAGVAVSTGTTTYSPTITANKTYYVEDPGGASASLGKTVVGAASTIWGGAAAADFSDAGKINQIIVAKALTINSIAVYVSAGTSVTINLKQGGTAVHTKTVTVAGTGKQTINLGFTVAPGTYVLDAVGTTATLGFEATGGAPAFPYIFPDYLTFTYNVAWSQTNGWYGYFYDLKFTAGNVCARTPVTAVLDPNNAKCNGATTITQTIALQAGWNLISTNVVATDNTIATLFNTLDVQEIKTADGFWLNGQIATFNNITTIEAGNGYLVKMNTAGTLTITGTALLTTNLQYPTTTGWHLIGCPFQTVTTLASQFTAVNTTTVKNFEGFWEPNGGVLNSIGNLEPGKGYFVNTK
jgi:hypothetical protein